MDKTEFFLKLEGGTAASDPGAGSDPTAQNPEEQRKDGAVPYHYWQGAESIPGDSAGSLLSEMETGVSAGEAGRGGI